MAHPLGERIEGLNLPKVLCNRGTERMKIGFDGSGHGWGEVEKCNQMRSNLFSRRGAQSSASLPESSSSPSESQDSFGVDEGKGRDSP